MMRDPVGVIRDMDNRGVLASFEPVVAGLRMERLAGARHKDNLEHSIRVLEYAIARESKPDLILRTAALLHDVGKPATRRIGGRNSVTFDGHEVVGAKIARRILKKHGFTAGEIDEIAELIALHMRSHGFEESGSWSDSAVRRLVNDVSTSEQMDRLLIIFYSDVTTKHDHKREAIHRQVDLLAQEIERVKAEDARKALRPAIDGFEVMAAFNLEPGRKLGRIMRFLNSDEGISMSREEALAHIKKNLQNF